MKPTCCIMRMKLETNNQNYAQQRNRTAFKRDCQI